MKLLSDEKLFVIRETVRRLGPGAIVKYLLCIGLVLWFLWPEVKDMQPAITPQQAETLAREPLPPMAEQTEEDLREKMTAEQSAFYWDSFTRMMEQGAELKQKSFETSVIFVSYVKDKPFQAENGLACIPYSEKVILAGKSNLRRGLACNAGNGRWCRQPEGEKALCREPKSGGIAEDTFVTLHNLKIDWDRNIRGFGF
jgi:hypothetical protein